VNKSTFPKPTSRLCHPAQPANLCLQQSDEILPPFTTKNTPFKRRSTEKMPESGNYPEKRSLSRPGK
jgi:hypothetical protein